MRLFASEWLKSVERASDARFSNHLSSNYCFETVLNLFLVCDQIVADLLKTKSVVLLLLYVWVDKYCAAVSG